MVKKSKLLAALNAHKGKDYQLEKQKKFQKQAAKRKRLNPTKENLDTELESLGAAIAVNGSKFTPKAESDGWESEGTENAVPMAVRRLRLKRTYWSILMQLDRYITHRRQRQRE